MALSSGVTIPIVELRDAGSDKDADRKDWLVGKEANRELIIIGM
jgi:hypothetical protein